MLARPSGETLIWQGFEVFHWVFVWLWSAKWVSGLKYFGDSWAIEILYGIGIVAHMAMLTYICVKIIGDISYPERDVVRAEGGTDDPLAGPLEGLEDKFGAGRKATSQA